MFLHMIPQLSRVSKRKFANITRVRNVIMDNPSVLLHRQTTSKITSTHITSKFYTLVVNALYVIEQIKLVKSGKNAMITFQYRFEMFPPLVTV